MLTVEKIGGTSMSQFQDVLKNIIIGSRKPEELYNRIFVVSAYNNVTNWLLEHKKSGEPGIYVRFLNNEDYKVSLNELCEKLLDINREFASIGLDTVAAEVFLRQRIEQANNYLESMYNVIASGYVSKADIYLASQIGRAHV